MDNCWTTVLWSGSTKSCNRLRKHFRRFALKYFFGLDIKIFIDLKIFGATFGIGGLLPTSPPVATRLPLSQYATLTDFCEPCWKVDTKWSLLSAGPVIGGLPFGPTIYNILYLTHNNYISRNVNLFWQMFIKACFNVYLYRWHKYGCLIS